MSTPFTRAMMGTPMPCATPGTASAIARATQELLDIVTPPDSLDSDPSARLAEAAPREVDSHHVRAQRPDAAAGAVIERRAQPGVEAVQLLESRHQPLAREVPPRAPQRL